MTTCNATCKWAVTGHTDAAKRIYDAVNIAWYVFSYDCVGKWMAFKLEDGRGDHEVYPTKRDAIRHVSDELLYAFLVIHPDGMGLCEAEIMLDFTRSAVKAGFRLADPDRSDGGPDIIPRIGTENIHAQIRALKKAGG
jgi:hypothetical protein